MLPGFMIRFLTRTMARPINGFLNGKSSRTLPRMFGTVSRRPRLFSGGLTAGWIVTAVALALCIAPLEARAAPIEAGVAKVDITDREAGPVNDPLYVKALVLKHEATTAVIITVDAVAIGEIGRIGNDYLGDVRARIEKELRIDPQGVMINASHCHGVVCNDVKERTFQAVKQAAENLVPVHVGVGVGTEDRIQENRRLLLKDGREVDVRHAYSLPPDGEIAGVGPVDPEIGILRLDRLDGRTLAVVYNFACHPIQGVPSGGNTADITGFASRVIEENLSEGTIALFLQGCAGDINPAMYKVVHLPRDAETQGNLLGLSTLRALKDIACKEDDRLKVQSVTIQLPRADVAQRIISLEAEQQRLLGSLQGTNINLKTFIPLVVKYSISGDFPAFYSHRYLHEAAQDRNDLTQLDATNRRNIQQYIRNIHTMEALTRTQTNLALLRKHQADLLERGKRTIDVELVGLRIGDFVMTTFPGELTVQIGLNLKQASPHDRTFIAGYTNGYIYYAPTAEQLQNVGGAQEDSDCILAPAWQAIYEKKAAQILKGL
jgi:hypothetical protein